MVLTVVVTGDADAPSDGTNVIFEETCVASGAQPSSIFRMTCLSRINSRGSNRLKYSSSLAAMNEQRMPGLGGVA